MKITNIKEKDRRHGTRVFLLVEDECGWKPGHTTDLIETLLYQDRFYWWELDKTDNEPAVVEATLDQAIELVEHGYAFEVVGDSMVKITNIKKATATFVENPEGWKPIEPRPVWELEKYLDLDKRYSLVSTDTPSNKKPAVARLKFEDAIALKSEGYTFDIVEEDEEMNETEGPKFYALQDRFGLVMDLPNHFAHGFNAGLVISKGIDTGGGYIIFTSLESAKCVANLSRKEDGLDKLQVVEVDPIAKKVVKVVEEPKPTKWRIAWSGGESTPKWFKGNTLGDWSLVTSKSEAREFDTLENAERVVKILGLNGLYITEGK